MAPYRSGLGAAVRRAKADRDRRVAAVLARHFGRRQAALVPRLPGLAVVPVPSPWTRRLTRGFSLTHLMARHLASAAGVPLEACLRMAPGQRQARLGRRERRSNLAGRLTARAAAPAICVLVDDVVTTGATAERCAEELVCEGAREVWLFTLCAAAARERVTTAQIL
jgi:predicted amidophosphoribosyltransferase